MNGVFNNNFLIGMLLSRGLPRNEQFLTGMAAGQMPENQPVAPLFLKPIIDQRLAAESGRATAEAQAGALQQRLEVELPAGAEQVTLRVPGVPNASFARVAGSTGTTVDPATGVVNLPSTGNEATVAIASDGVVREVVVVRGGRIVVESSPGLGTGAAAGAAMTNDQLAAIGGAFVAAFQAFQAAQTPQTPQPGSTPNAGGASANAGGGKGGSGRAPVEQGLADVLASPAAQTAAPAESAPARGASGAGASAGYTPPEARPAKQTSTK